MIVIVDYHLGNLASIANMLKKCGVTSIITSDPQIILRAEKLILPGVGAFAKGIENLKKLNLIELLREKVLVKKTPILGICLGMQLFAKNSEEGNAEGLSWITARVIRFKASSSIKTFHMGWNTVALTRQSELFKNMTEDMRFYFAHSYYFVSDDNDVVLATTYYGDSFISVVQKENIYGVQFHPEKSHKFGLNLLKNFSEVS